MRKEVQPQQWRRGVLYFLIIKLKNKLHEKPQKWMPIFAV
jgi:hypothetical protein